MECIIAYLLLAVFIDLALEIARMDCTEDEAQWVKRNLWGQTPFDCGTRAVGAIATVPRQHAEWKRNRFRVGQGESAETVVSAGSSKWGVRGVRAENSSGLARTLLCKNFSRTKGIRFFPMNERPRYGITCCHD